MIYSYDDTLKIFLRIYEYLSLKVKDMPCSVKLWKPKHREAIVSFLEKLPPSAGVDFIWEFLVFQFYVYSEQKHNRRPLPVWFIGAEAWERWASYNRGANYHAQQWAVQRKLENPVKMKSYTPVREEALRRERYRMSRISGPNFCGAKYGDYPYDEEDLMCIRCPFKKECEVLFLPDSDGVNLFQKVNCSETVIELPSRVNVRQTKHQENYEDFE